MNRIIELLQEIFSATEEQSKAFTDAMKAKKIYTASEENLDVRFGKLKEQSAAKDTKLKEYEGKIAAFESGMTGHEALQQDLTAAQNRITPLEAQLKKAQVEAQGHLALLTAGAKPDAIDFLMFRLQADGELEQDEKGKVKGLDDKITALKTNIGEVNRLKTDILNIINDEILALDNSDIGIPLGSLFLPELLSGRGPSIPVHILSIRNSDANFHSRFTQAGINQTLHQVTMEVSIDVAVLVLGQTTSFTMESEVVVAETVIVGDVPNTFINTGGNYGSEKENG